MTVSASIAKKLILVLQRTRFAGVGGYSDDTMQAQGYAGLHPQAQRESQFFGDFFEFFDVDIAAHLRGKDVLDFGCGFGGKTVEYKRISGARSVWGVEPFEHVVDRAKEYAASVGATDVEFRLCSQDAIPLPDASVDVVLSHDVLEHVADPLVSMREVHRVLRPGGTVFAVFPVYFGAASHHLDYVAALPGLHWLFAPGTLITAINSVLDERPEFRTDPQPLPQRSFDGRRDVLPNLNGLSGEHLPELAQGFEVTQLTRNALLRRRPGIGSVSRFLTRVLPSPRLQDMLTGSISCVLRKPADEQ